MFELADLVRHSAQVRAGLSGCDDVALESLAIQLEDAVRLLTGLGLDVVAAMVTRGDGTPCRPRLRDLLANALNISAHDAGARIAASKDLAGPRPVLEQAAAAGERELLGCLGKPPRLDWLWPPTTPAGPTRSSASGRARPGAALHSVRKRPTA